MPPIAGARARWRNCLRPTLGMVILAVCLVVLLLPLSGLLVLRLYETELLRQTEAELHGQAAFIDALFRAELKRELSRRAGIGHLTDLRHHGIPAPPRALESLPGAGHRPVEARLDAATDPLFAAPDYRDAPGTRPDGLARTVGRRLQPLLESARQRTLSDIALADHQGLIVAATDVESGLSLRHLDEIRAALKGDTHAVLRKRGPGKSDAASRVAGVHVFVASPIILDDQIVAVSHIARTPKSLGRAFAEKRGGLIIVGIVIALVVLLLAAFATVTVTRPVRALIRQADLAARGNAGGAVPIERPRTREIARLSEAIATMSGVLEQRAAYIRDFAYHVSHEFKTPLTSMEGTLELLRDHLDGMTPERRQAFLANMGADVDRLARLVTRLLQLARADMLTSGDERTLLRDAFGRLASRYGDLGLAVRAPGPGLEMSVPLSREVFDTIFGNLFENSQRQGATAVLVTAEPSGAHGAIDILVTDDGPGIPESHAAQIFTPFFTTGRKADNQGDRPAREHKTSTGLGLAIVRSLLIGHGGGIALEFPGPGGPDSDGPWGACFRLTLPVAPKR